MKDFGASAAHAREADALQITRVPVVRPDLADAVITEPGGRGYMAGSMHICGVKGLIGSAIRLRVDGNDSGSVLVWGCSRVAKSELVGWRDVIIASHHCVRVVVYL